MLGPKGKYSPSGNPGLKRHIRPERKNSSQKGIHGPKRHSWPEMVLYPERTFWAQKDILAQNYILDPKGISWLERAFVDRKVIY